MLPKFEMIKCSVLLFTSPIFDFEVIRLKCFMLLFNIEVGA